MNRLTRLWPKTRATQVVLTVVIATLAVTAITKGPLTQSGASGRSRQGTIADAGGTTSTLEGDRGESDDLVVPPGVTATTFPIPTTTTEHTTACRSGDPLANVYHPYRLQVMDRCRTVAGMVTALRREDDGDVHFDLSLDAVYSNLVNEKNRSDQNGWLVVEIVPADKPGCTVGQPPKPPAGTYDFGTCTGADETTPAFGTHIWVTGPYVLDHAHGWMEIHPVWSWSAAGPPDGTKPTQNNDVSSSPTTSPPVRGTQVQITSVTSPVKRGSTASLTARTDPNAGCNLSVTLPSGAQSQSQGLGPSTADGNGTVTWSWRTGSNTSPGPAHAHVTCGSAAADANFEITA